MKDPVSKLVELRLANKAMEELIQFRKQHAAMTAQANYNRTHIHAVLPKPTIKAKWVNPDVSPK